MRIQRARSEADVYHVVSRGVGQQIIFEDDKDRVSFLDFVARASRDFNVEVYAWCLMSNHVHLLLHVSKTICPSSD